MKRKSLYLNKLKQINKQINKQTTIVKVKSGCCRTKKRKLYFPKKKPVCLTVVCGDIFQPCNGESQTYFTNIDSHLAAMVKVTNDTPCTMVVALDFRACTRSQDVGQGQQISFYVPSIEFLRVRCMDCEQKICMGRYEISLFRRLN
jgi:hypothetical protein